MTDLRTPEQLAESARKALRTPDLEWARELVHGLANDVLELVARLQAAERRAEEAKRDRGSERGIMLDLRNRADALACRVEELEAALRDIIRYRGQPSGSHAWDMEMRAIARAALAAGEEDAGE